MGKDTIVSRCVEQFGWHKSVSYSSRPKRPSEVEGIDYFFRPYVEIMDMIDNGETYEHTEYKTNMGTWLYAFGVESFSDESVNLCIVNPEGMLELLQTELHDRLAIIYVEADDKTRFERYTSRLGGIENMTIEQKAEGYDRLSRDYKDFTEFDQWLYENKEIPVLKISNLNNQGDGSYIMFKILEFVNEVNDEA